MRSTLSPSAAPSSLSCCCPSPPLHWGHQEGADALAVRSVQVWDRRENAAGPRTQGTSALMALLHAPTHTHPESSVLQAAIRYCCTSGLMTVTSYIMLSKYQAQAGGLYPDLFELDTNIMVITCSVGKTEAQRG